MGEADKREVIVRTSRTRAVGGALLFALAILIFGVWDQAHGSGMSPWVCPAIAAVFAASGLSGLWDTKPRLVFAPEGVAWRDKKAPMHHLPWSEIAKAEIVNGGEDEPRSLRLTLARPALESVASERKHKVDINIETIDLDESRLRRIIHGFAPHLFGPKKR